MFRIEVASDYAQMWRYNTLMSCAGYNEAGEELYIESAERVWSEEFQSEIIKLPNPPRGFDPAQSLSLECGEANSLRLLVYVVAHTLPEDRVVENSPPFDIEVTIYRDREVVYRDKHAVNQWGGASISIEP